MYIKKLKKEIMNLINKNLLKTKYNVGDWWFQLSCYFNNYHNNLWFEVKKLTINVKKESVLTDYEIVTLNKKRKKV